MSYNILADMYASSAFCRTVLYPYCPPAALGAGYRLQLIARELARAAPDLAALQECTRAAFRGYLAPLLDARGFASYYTQKDGKGGAGCALVWRRARQANLTIRRRAPRAGPCHCTDAVLQDARK